VSLVPWICQSSKPSLLQAPQALPWSVAVSLSPPPLGLRKLQVESVFDRQLKELRQFERIRVSPRNGMERHKQLLHYSVCSSKIPSQPTSGGQMKHGIHYESCVLVALVLYSSPSPLPFRHRPELAESVPFPSNGSLQTTDC
jgi:hypothetical protein